MLSEEEKNDVRDVFSKLGYTNTEQWQINEDLVNILGEMISESKVCTSRAKLAPIDILTSFKPGYMALAKSFLKVYMRANSDDKKVYAACLNTIKNNFRIRIGNAANGL
ncbi:hypothetical protein IBE48_09680 [Francisella philomiragia]|uniref:Uncharacterized protein n=1 Tax=Francisella philomiragia TaxID=28110 RepID=A0AAW3DBL0_9GAMM|nr:hypothetical protein [Francisella philomiragia]KFJ43116.1 hypothetical protein DR78_1981 [Francisella philomiragia]MBK2255714.1 hypothetical protein [Francisella philomiragia]MBK2274033.1 hypothetical protein [Francisella philomiragia]MBK2277869.1 hypothetical protein [Francisella philomiragia]MBK2281814.1 hypothetical protein [Francisella philomiragia]